MLHRPTQAVIVSHYVPFCPLFSQKKIEVSAVSISFFFSSFFFSFSFSFSSLSFFFCFFFSFSFSSSPSSDVTRGKDEVMAAKYYPPPPVFIPLYVAGVAFLTSLKCCLSTRQRRQFRSSTHVYCLFPESRQMPELELSQSPGWLCGIHVVTTLNQQKTLLHFAVT